MDAMGRKVSRAQRICLLLASAKLLPDGGEKVCKALFEINWLMELGMEVAYEWELRRAEIGTGGLLKGEQILTAIVAVGDRSVYCIPLSAEH